MEEDVANNAVDPWVPPNDRQLALRAKLRFGWSPKSSQIAGLTGSPSASRSNSSKNLETITPNEQEMIVQVIRRAETVTEKEHARVGKLLERVRNIKKNAVGGDGVNQCVLCGDRAGLLSSLSCSGRHVTCKDCAKSVCQKCSVDTWDGNTTTYLCKLCSEQRETWKKSGAWFYEQA